ncbi:putative integrase/recombinase (plasmid) [Cupriavidus necator H16]|uniref:Putative integrase/recombinase n=2 Tax=Cupriavidus necator TaxID=106590 RepID=Q7WXJ5_CUPNH|nr:putative integrase/recombinase [Cupriavidus necator H16]
MRCTPLRPDVVAVLKQWLLYQPGEPGDPVFPSSRGGHLSADALQRLVSRNAEIARLSCPSLKKKSITPHTLRHYMPFPTMSCNRKIALYFMGKRMHGDRDSLDSFLQPQSIREGVHHEIHHP